MNLKIGCVLLLTFFNTDIEKTVNGIQHVYKV
jgi:hypothetical protein